jgi:hypothetical protein
MVRVGVTGVNATKSSRAPPKSDPEPAVVLKSVTDCCTRQQGIDRPATRMESAGFATHELLKFQKEAFIAPSIQGTPT